MLQVPKSDIARFRKASIGIVEKPNMSYNMKEIFNSWGSLLFR